MNLIINRPILIYDDMCSSCSIFAKHAYKYSRGQIDCIGHFSKDGEKIRKLIFPPNYNETEMFWIITSNRAYGGRSGLIPLFRLIVKGLLLSFIKYELPQSQTFIGDCSDSATCNNKKFKIKRLINLLRSGKKMNVTCLK